MYSLLICIIAGLVSPVFFETLSILILVLVLLLCIVCRYKQLAHRLSSLGIAILISSVQLQWVKWHTPDVHAATGIIEIKGSVEDRLGGSGALLVTQQSRYYLPKGIGYLGCHIRSLGYVRSPKKGNREGFDEQQWLKRHGIHAVWQARSVTPIRCEPGWVHRIWTRVASYLESLPITHHREIQSLLIGFSKSKPHYWYELGMIHLLTISGLHIRLLVESVSQLWANTRGKKAKNTGRIVGLGIAYGYLVVLGFGTPALRAWLFLLLQFISQHLRLKWSRLYCFWVVVAIILALDPLAVYDLGFWLSHIATLTLLCVSALAGQDKHQNTESASVSVFLALSMVSIYQYQPINIVSILANMLIAEYFVMLILPTLATGGLGLCLGGLLGLSLTYVGDVFIYVDWMFSQIDTVVYWIQHFFKWHMFLTTDRILSVLMVCVLRYVFRAPWVIMCLLLISMPGEVIPKGQFYVHMFDVGHGLSVFIQTQKHQLLYDIGSQGIQDVAAKRILPFLYQHHVNFLDALVVSHPDTDHSNGVNQLLANIYVHKIWVGVPLEISQPRYAVNRHTQSLCQRGQKWVWDGVTFEFLHPDQADVWQGNNQSCVLKVTGNDNQLLLTGDIEKAAEKSLLTNQTALMLRSSYLLLPHHGSQTSATPDFMSAVSPSKLLVSESKHKLHERWQLDDRVHLPPYSSLL